MKGKHSHRVSWNEETVRMPGFISSRCLAEHTDLGTNLSKNSFFGFNLEVKNSPRLDQEDSKGEATISEADSVIIKIFRCILTQFFLFFFLESLSMLLPTLEWLVALLMLETLSEECCLRMRRSVDCEVPLPGNPRQEMSHGTHELMPLSWKEPLYLNPHISTTRNFSLDNPSTVPWLFS